VDELKRNILPLLLPLVFLYVITRNLLLPVLAGAVVIFLFWPQIRNLFGLRTFDHSMRVEEGVAIWENKSIAVLKVIDVPFDYRDFSGESLRDKVNMFYRSINVSNDVTLIVKRSHVDKTDYLRELMRSAQNLRISVDADPSNQQAKRKLELVQKMIDRLNEGEAPFRYQFYVLVEGKNKEEVKSVATVIKSGLASIGLKTSVASAQEIRNLLNMDIRDGRGPIVPSQLPFLTPFSQPKAPRSEMWSNGLYLGLDMEHGIPVFWNFSSAQNSHLLVLGPTGSGKTEFLLWTSIKLNSFSDIPIVALDIKGDIRVRLKRDGVQHRVLSPLVKGLGLLEVGEVPIEVRAQQIEGILSKSFRLDKYTSSLLYEAIISALRESATLHVTWDDVMEKVRTQDVKDVIYIKKVIDSVKFLDLGGRLLDNLYDGINVVDLSLLKTEELRRLVAFTVITDLMNKYSSQTPDRPKIGILIDEAWTILRSETEEYPLVAELVKRGRGHGIFVMMATQNPQDLGKEADVFLDNVGLTVLLNNGDRKFWAEAARFVELSPEEVDRYLMYMGRGEALVRFLGDPRPLKVILDVAQRWST
jgi:Type IV secretory pathway, VirB4 components